MQEISNTVEKKYPKKKVCFILPTLLPLAGLEVLTIGLMEEFLKNNVDVDLVIVHGDDDYEGYFDTRIRVFKLKKNRLFKSILAIKTYINTHKPYSIYVAMWPLTSLTGIALALSSHKCDLIFSDHNPLSEQYGNFNFIKNFLMKIFINLTYRLCNYHVSVSADVRADLLKTNWLKGNHFVVINNLVKFPENKQLPIDDLKYLNTLKDFKGHKILSVGRMKEQKNHRLLIDAFELVLKKHDAILIIVGSGPKFDETKDYVRKKNMLDKVIMPGHSLQVSEYYKYSDIFALSSLYEGFGNVLIEAMHFGLPIVSTNCSGGPKEILKNNKYGLLVPNHSPKLLANGMIALLIGEVSFDKDYLRKRADNYSPSNISNQYLDLMSHSK
jgi:glycosyltransferase involved in cell wall biosynthesis